MVLRFKYCGPPIFEYLNIGTSIELMRHFKRVQHLWSPYFIRRNTLMRNLDIEDLVIEFDKINISLSHV